MIRFIYTSTMMEHLGTPWALASGDAVHLAAPPRLCPDARDAGGTTRGDASHGAMDHPRQCLAIRCMGTPQQMGVLSWKIP